MNIGAAAVKELREKTGAGMMDCKRVLIATGGDFTAAQQRLKEMGLATGRSDRPTNEGRVFSRVANSKAGIAELTCETDFVARNTDFVSLGKSVLEQLVDKAASAEQVKPLIAETSGKIRGEYGAGSIPYNRKRR